jgi:hypothetical protein
VLADGLHQHCRLYKLRTGTHDGQYV